MSLLFLSRVNIYEFLLFIGEFNIHIGFRQGRRLIQLCILIYFNSKSGFSFLFFNDICLYNFEADQNTGILIGY